MATPDTAQHQRGLDSGGRQLRKPRRGKPSIPRLIRTTSSARLWRCRMHDRRSDIWDIWEEEEEEVEEELAA